MSKNLRLRAAVAGAMVGGCLMGTAAYAATAWGGMNELGPYGGYTYTYQTRVQTNSGDANGGVLLQTKHSNQVPTGYMGAQASLWRSNGTLCADTPWDYNNTPLVSMLRTTYQYGDCGPGYYYGDGQVAVYRPGAGVYAYGYPPGSPIQYQSN